MTAKVNKTDKVIKDKAEKAEKETKPKKITLKDQVEALANQVEELRDQKLRIAAEFDNFRRRSLEEKSSWIKNATERLIIELCDVKDNFERAVQVDNSEENGDSYRKGIELIYQQLENILKKEGVKKIEALESDFDPRFHDALAHIPSELEENKVAAVIQNGYTMNDKVIRAARVAVSNGVKPQPAENKEKKDN